MAKFKVGMVTYDDSGMDVLLKALGAESRETKQFIRDTMSRATSEVVKIAKAGALAAGYPASPGIRYTTTRGQKYRVYGRVPNAIKKGRFVAKRRDGGDTSQRVLVSQSRAGTGAPHANITRYSKDFPRFTSDGKNRGQFAPKPFMRGVLIASQGALLRAARKKYAFYARTVGRVK